MSMDDHLKMMSEYFARLPHLGFEVMENEILGDKIIVDQNPTPTSRGRFTVGNMYRFFISIWGLEEGVSYCAKWAINKINSKIDKYK